MKNRKTSFPNRKEDGTRTEISVAKIGLVSAVIVAIVSMIGTILSGIISLRASWLSVVFPIQATQTAEAKNLYQALTAGPTSGSPTRSPSLYLPTSSPPTTITTDDWVKTPTYISCSKTITIGFSMPCDIPAPGDINIHTFSARQGDQVYYKILNLTGNLRLQVTANDPEGKELTYDFTCCEVKRTFNALKKGPYQIRVEDKGQESTGSYLLYLQILNNPELTKPLPVEQLVKDSINSPYEHDTYLFNATANRQVEIKISKQSVTSPMSIQAVVLTPEGKEVISQIDSTEVEVNFSPSQSGPLLLLVFSKQTGDYSLFQYSH